MAGARARGGAADTAGKRGGVMPNRIQRRRTPGWRAPEGAVYVGRGTRWGNPWVVVQTSSDTGWTVNWASHRRQLPHGLESAFPAHNQRAAHARAAEAYETWLRHDPQSLEHARDELAGRDLMCWCHKSLPCHADVLLRIANKEA
ncbi:DUF4326 domain-containing protein [Streptomyces sp. NPDC017529]|uniref:DUF4326 domain-containing protein n=1 Tax=Streptomyces sp. NPDC017529 TaxID=3365000 RepID=UPI00379539BE